MGNPIDLTGKKFGKLTPAYRVENNKYGRARWLCFCVCGESITVTSNALNRGNTKSCGCFRREETSRRKKTHGLTQSIEYRAWQNMKDRCTNPKNKRYKTYAGRGIIVCKRWMNSFENFLYDMGDRPSIKHSIERHNNDSGYNPCNCYWAKIDAQANNKSTCKKVTHDGKTLTHVQWSKLLGGSKGLVHMRINRGWDEIKAISTPTFKKFRHFNSS